MPKTQLQEVLYIFRKNLSITISGRKCGVFGQCLSGQILLITADGYGLPAPFYFVARGTSVFPLEKFYPVDMPTGQNDLGIEERQFEKEANCLIDEFTGMAEMGCAGRIIDRFIFDPAKGQLLFRGGLSHGGVVGDNRLSVVFIGGDLQTSLV